MEQIFYLVHYCKINDRRKIFYEKKDKEDYIDLDVVFIKKLILNKFSILFSIYSYSKNAFWMFI
jgi:hypothetical protein